MSTIPNADQQGFMFYRWAGRRFDEVLDLEHEPRSEESWHGLTDEVKISYRNAASAADSVLSYLDQVVESAPIGAGSDHFQHGRETMRDDVRRIISETWSEAIGDVSWKTPS